MYDESVSSGKGLAAEGRTDCQLRGAQRTVQRSKFTAALRYTNISSLVLSSCNQKLEIFDKFSYKYQKWYFTKSWFRETLFSRQTDRQTDREKERDRQTEIDRERDRQTDRQRDRDRQTDRETDRQRQTERETDRLRDRQTDRHDLLVATASRSTGIVACRLD